MHTKEIATLHTRKTMPQKSKIRRGDIYYADLTPTVGSEQGGIRPILVISNDIGNQHSPTIIVASISSRTKKSKKHNLPTHIQLPKNCGLALDSVVMMEQIRTLDRLRLREYIGHIYLSEIPMLQKALNISLGYSFS